VDEDGLLACFDNCPNDWNPGQENADRNFVDTSPPYVVATDDKTWPMSDAMGDACDNDDDNDGLSDSDEGSGASCAGIVTNPLLADSDQGMPQTAANGDRFLDGAECILGTNPTDLASKPVTFPNASNQCAIHLGVTVFIDTDGDRIRDWIEFCHYGTNPAVADTDGDAIGGMDGDGGKDGCEVASINGDQVVNSGDQGKLASGINHTQPYHSGVDLTKDGILNSGDQGLMASFISLPGQCP
jgi:hypothetical protein